MKTDWPSLKSLKNLQRITTTKEKNDLKENYESSSGMQTNIWGPAMWMTIHVVSFNYPVKPTKNQMNDYAIWLTSIRNILPCKYCRENFKENMTTSGWSWSNPSDNEKILESRYMFSHFCWRLHNNVNLMLGKTSPPFKEVRNRFESMRASCLSEKEKIELKEQSKELGCIRPLHNGERGKCVISIVPVKEDVASFTIHQKCLANKCNF